LTRSGFPVPGRARRCRVGDLETLRRRIAMPMPREEDDDLFPSEADVDFDDDAAEKPRKKKVVKAEDDAPKRKTVKKKVAKKKVTPTADAEVKPVRRKVAKKKAIRPAEPADETPLEESGDPLVALSDESARGKSLPGFGARPPRKPAAEPAEAVAPAAESKSPDRARTSKPSPGGDAEESDAEPAPVDDTIDEYGRPRPQANYAVHVYEFGRYKRTIEHDFTPEEADAYATEFSRTAKHYGRQAIAGKKDTTPVKVID